MSTADGVFKGKYGDKLEGTKGRWVGLMEPEDRRIWASLGRMATSEHDINWHALGGVARARASRRIPKGQEGAGRFAPVDPPVEHHPADVEHPEMGL